ncbi:MAG: cobalamin-independent methionine synthase II family protein [Desulfobacteraceae bacterium]|jgi:5-methyltetrahydropteroyltriglutamate--homocysteine methyltransferase|nr:cobalamin-independent methionine synthase II family protein [Desulfobacteraceae bacterium]
MTKIKTTHVGSLPRPAEMMAKLLRKQDVTAVDLKHYLTAILERQLSLGLTYINNGELPRMDYVQSTVSRISGFGATDTAPMPRDLEELPELSRRFGGRNGLITLNPKAPVKLPACSEPLVYTGEASLRDELEMMACVYEKLKPSHMENETDLFFTSPSPGTVALFMENKHYQDDEAYIEAIASVLKQEYDIIAGYGFQLQIDCPDLAMGRHTRYKHLTDSAFIDRVHLNVRALNRALSSIDPDRCRVHICWGNYAGTHHCDVNLKTIFNPIMKARARFVSLEASNHRHAHEWVVFKELPFPEEKVLMPGVIDTSSTIVEHPDLVAQRIINFADILGADRVIASTDCGFATTASASAVSGEVAWMKLATLVEGARRASKRFS